MSKLSLISSLKEADLQIPEGQLTGGNLREAFRRLFAQLNPYFDGINKLASKGITLADNLNADVVTAKFSHGVAQQVLLKTLKRAGSALVVSADGQIAIGASVQMIQIPPGQKYGPLASVTVFFGDVTAASVTCTLILLPDGTQSTTVPVYPMAWVAPTLLNSWVNYDTTVFQPAGYFKDPLGIVRLRGLVKSGTVTTSIFLLPSGFRPLQGSIFAVTSNDLFGECRVGKDGNVVATAGSNVFFSLDGITFDTR